MAYGNPSTSYGVDYYGDAGGFEMTVCPLDGSPLVWHGPLDIRDGKYHYETVCPLAGHVYTESLTTAPAIETTYTPFLMRPRDPRLLPNDLFYDRMN